MWATGAAEGWSRVSAVSELMQHWLLVGSWRGPGYLTHVDFIVNGSSLNLRTRGQPTGPFFSNAKTVSSGTTVHPDLTHVARNREHGAEARGRPSVRLMFLCVHSVTNFSRNKTNITRYHKKNSQRV